MRIKSTRKADSLGCPLLHTKILNKRRCIKAFIQDASCRKNIRTCNQCGWFGLEEDNPDTCPFCGNKALTKMCKTLRPKNNRRQSITEIVANRHSMAC